MVLRQSGTRLAANEDFAFDLSAQHLDSRIYPEEVLALKTALNHTNDYQRLVNSLNGASNKDPALKQQFKIISNLQQLIGEIAKITNEDPAQRQDLNFIYESFKNRFLPVNVVAYSNCKISVGQSALTVSTGERLYRDLDFGYQPNKYSFFKRLGSIPQMVINQSGQVTQLGFKTEAQKDFFLENLLCKEMTNEEISKIRRLNKEVFEYLRGHPVANEKLKEFVEDRGWPDGVLKKAGIVYFGPEVDISEWAKAKGYSDDDLYYAGWYEKKVNNNGRIKYTVNNYAGIRIPFFDTQGEIVSFRVRSLDDSARSKYLSWPLRRHLEMIIPLAAKLFNSNSLQNLNNSPLNIVEGEFKCLVTEVLSETPTVGITGITQVDDEIIQNLVNANASCYNVIFDFDSRGKALQRADLITDSERAAYRTAIKLIKAGAKEVKIVVLNSEDGSKVGSDDLLLSNGGVGKFKERIASAMTPGGMKAVS